MWKREVNGLRLTFHLAGINNQNFLMRDEETGTWWQQISGRAISGRLAGMALELVPSDELTLALWKSEQPRGTIMKDVPQFVPEYSPKNWDVEMKKTPVVISYAQPGLAPRDLMLGIAASGAARAFPYDAVIARKLVQDRVGSEPVLLLVGPDGVSVRAFRAKPSVDFYRTFDDRAAKTAAASAPLMLDSGGTKWNFQGCAIDGPSAGACLDRVEVIKDYWFDWRHYHPDTTVFGIAVNRRATGAAPAPRR